MDETSGEIVAQGDGLGQSRQIALQALTAGKSFPEAAREAGVCRASVYRWMREDAEFRAAYNAWRQEAVESAQSRVMLADKAVDTLDKALEREDRTVAMTILQKMGALRRPRRQSTDPEVLKLQMELRQKKAEHRAAEGMIKHLLTKVGFSQDETRRYLKKHGIKGVFEEFRKVSAAKDNALPAPTDPTPADKTRGQTPGETTEAVSHDSAAERKSQLIENQ
jgi:hypothetical protein